MIPKIDNSNDHPPSQDHDGREADNTKPVWKEPRLVGGHRLNELYNRFRQIAIEMKGLTLTDLAEKKQDSKLEEDILDDFIKLKQKYLTEK